MKKLRQALKNQLFTEDVQADHAFVFYILTLTLSFLLTVWLIGSFIWLLIALLMMTCFVILVIILAIIFDKGD